MDGTVAFRSVNKKFPESYNSAARSRRTVKLNAILQRILKDHLILKKQIFFSLLIDVMIHVNHSFAEMCLLIGSVSQVSKKYGRQVASLKLTAIRILVIRHEVIIASPRWRLISIDAHHRAWGITTDITGSLNETGVRITRVGGELTGFSRERLGKVLISPLMTAGHRYKSSWKKINSSYERERERERERELKQ